MDQNRLGKWYLTNNFSSALAAIPDSRCLGNDKRTNLPINILKCIFSKVLFRTSSTQMIPSLEAVGGILLIQDLPCKEVESVWTRAGFTLSSSQSEACTDNSVPVGRARSESTSSHRAFHSRQDILHSTLTQLALGQTHLPTLSTQQERQRSKKQGLGNRGLFVSFFLRKLSPTLQFRWVPPPTHLYPFSTLA